ncbi:MAG: LacI family transcriptional regulator [Mesorhizobium sp.]|nr:MAG: LacI family transcriptional regulator [Mesorhizobium sp.]RWM89253.1 MAG: LacI family transcriptional regulator [Mesorhizobium sp.]TJV54657.1 MAG: LacI family DNA-binding transcriptional regulator [Mesorhizobium sp.]
MSVTINDVARHAGVSRSTVSLVLHQNPRISAETAQHEEASMRALGYTFNRAAANLRKRAFRSGRCRDQRHSQSIFPPR